MLSAAFRSLSGGADDGRGGGEGAVCAYVRVRMRGVSDILMRLRP